MDCSNVTGKIDDFREGALSEGESGDIRQHIAKCRDCRELLSGAEAFDKELKGAFEAALPPSDFAARVTRLAGDSEIEQVRMRPVVWVTAAAAACLVFSFTLNAVLPDGRDAAPRSRPVSVGRLPGGAQSVGRAYTIDDGGRLQAYRGRTGVKIVWNITQNAPELVVDAFPGVQ